MAGHVRVRRILQLILYNMLVTLHVRQTSFSFALLDSRIPGHVYGILEDMSLDDCIEECILRRNCLSANYNTSGNSCELNTVANTSLLEITSDYIFAQKDQYLITHGGRCVYFPCPQRHKCVIGDCDCVGCIEKECDDPPVLPNAEYSGTHRIVEAVVEYTCQPNFRHRQNPPLTSTCTESLTWSAVQNECVANVEECSTHGWDDIEWDVYSSCPCQNNGTCVVLDVDTYECNCPPGYASPFCSDSYFYNGSP